VETEGKTRYKAMKVKGELLEKWKGKGGKGR
jgi:hypothetical protein